MSNAGTSVLSITMVGVTGFPPRGAIVVPVTQVAAHAGQFAEVTSSFSAELRRAPSASDFAAAQAGRPSRPRPDLVMSPFCGVHGDQ